MLAPTEPGVSAGPFVPSLARARGEWHAPGTDDADADGLGLPDAEDIAPPSLAQHVAGTGLTTLLTVGAMLIVFALIVGLIGVFFYFGVPHDPGPQ